MVKTAKYKHIKNKTTRGGLMAMVRAWNKTARNMRPNATRVYANHDNLELESTINKMAYYKDKIYRLNEYFVYVDDDIKFYKNFRFDLKTKEDIKKYFKLQKQANNGSLYTPHIKHVEKIKEFKKEIQNSN